MIDCSRSVTIDNVHFSSASNEWGTPQWIFDLLDREFGFDLDAASTDKNALCARHFTQEDDSLAQDWGRAATTVWLNPPYGRILPRFMEKAAAECARAPHLTVVMLIPARTDTKAWHSYCAPGEVRFLKGRLKFTKLAALAPADTHTHTHTHTPVAKAECAPFPSAVVVLGAKARAGTTLYVHYSEPTFSEGATEQAA